MSPTEPLEGRDGLALSGWKFLSLRDARCLTPNAGYQGIPGSDPGSLINVRCPTSLLPRFGVDWSSADDNHISARFEVDGRPIKIDLELDQHRMVRSVLLDRWSDPANTGTWGLHPFGGEITEYATFDGVTVPRAGRIGWFYGTDRWSTGEFFRFRLTDLRLVGHGKR